eukprot:1154203-Pelagomonas_calceolata.AAC.2
MSGKGHADLSILLSCPLKLTVTSGLQSLTPCLQPALTFVQLVQAPPLTCAHFKNTTWQC